MTIYHTCKICYKLMRKELENDDEHYRILRDGICYFCELKSRS